MPKPRRLDRAFFTRPTLAVAKNLLGKYLVRKVGWRTLAGKIVETEAYIGPEDKASHAFGGKITPRNRAEFMAGGHVYIYLVYGMYWQLNISTGKAGIPECVLIRALEPVRDVKFKMAKQNSKLMRMADGPGKLCRWLQLNKSFYGEDLTKSKRFWVQDRGVRVRSSGIVVRPRVGIDYAGPVWLKKPWRFYLKGNPAVSRL